MEPEDFYRVRKNLLLISVLCNESTSL